jgi:hypothetical protein
VNFARGEWQISRVYSVLGRPEPAIIHAERCLEHSLAAGLPAFDVAFAHEALSRAHSIAGQMWAAQRHRRMKRPARGSATPKTASCSSRTWQR